MQITTPHKLTFLQAEMLAHMRKAVEDTDAGIAQTMNISRERVVKNMGPLITGLHVVACRVIREGRDVSIVYRLTGAGPQPRKKATKVPA